VAIENAGDLTTFMPKAIRNADAAIFRAGPGGQIDVTAAATRLRGRSFTSFRTTSISKAAMAFFQKSPLAP
jgi:hypothetical protein